MNSESAVLNKFSSDRRSMAWIDRSSRKSVLFWKFKNTQAFAGSNAFHENLNQIMDGYVQKNPLLIASTSG